MIFYINIYYKFRLKIIIHWCIVFESECDAISELLVFVSLAFYGLTRYSLKSTKQRLGVCFHGNSNEHNFEWMCLNGMDVVHSSVAVSGLPLPKVIDHGQESPKLRFSRQSSGDFSEKMDLSSPTSSKWTVRVLYQLLYNTVLWICSLQN